MNLDFIFHSEWFKWVILPALIFFARIMDVTIGTIRIMFVSKGHRLMSPLLGFFEVLIWLLAIGQIMQNLSNVFCYIAYAGGFATGNWIGITIEEKLAYGKFIVRMIVKEDASGMVIALKKRGFVVTRVDAHGSQGKVDLVYTIIERSDLDHVIDTVETHNPRAFYSIEDTRLVNEGIFPSKASFIKRLFLRQFKSSQNR
jgi:uncharacterized protein YebE (UPF0316 family)